MKNRLRPLAVVLFLAATACGSVLGVDDGSQTVQCTKDSDCQRAEVCVAHLCSALGAPGGSSTAGPSGSNTSTGYAGVTGLGATTLTPRTGGTIGVETSNGGANEFRDSVGTKTSGNVLTSDIGLVGEPGVFGGVAGEGGTTPKAGIAGSSEAAGGLGRGGSTAPTVSTAGGSEATVGLTDSVGGTTALAGIVDRCDVNRGFAGGCGAATTAGPSGNAGSGGGMSDRTSRTVIGSCAGGGSSTGGVAGAGSVAGISDPPGVAGIGDAAGASAVGQCTAGDHRCYVLQTEQAPGFPVAWQTCLANRTWNDGELCPGHCSATSGGCAIAPSCAGLNLCSFGRNCCNSLPLPGGSFNRSQIIDSYGDDLCTDEDPCPATVSDFLLDTFEVTVGRFRNFMRVFSRDGIAPGSGKNPHNAEDPGWDETWNDLLPKDEEQLVQRIISRACPGANYTEEPGENEFEPINCIDWFLAAAFCIWDGGRLPTEIEWDYAASGGERRLYPWSVPPAANLISQEYAVYSDKTHLWSSPLDVGTAELGVSRWGQLDLAGNLFEWLIDAGLDSYVESEGCSDCANFGWSSTWLRRVRGGSYETDASVAEVAYRTTRTADLPWNRAGFRCARNP